MRVENIIIIALVAGLIYFGFIKQKSPGSRVTLNNQLPSQDQQATGDGGASTALISEGIGAATGVLNNLIDHAFQRSTDSAPPQTQVSTI